jgi:hypothetical protein
VPGVENIDHYRTKARHPQTNGICERFHRTIQEGFYATAFRKSFTLAWRSCKLTWTSGYGNYNLRRTHSGKYCYGKTPMQTFLDSADLAREKMLDSLRLPAPETERSPAQRSAGEGAAADAAA